MRHGPVAALILSATIVTPSAQEVAIASNQNHLFLLSDKTSTLQTALDEAASNGLHVVFGSNQGVYLRRAAAKEPSVAYRPVADSRTEAFEEALNTGGERGFRVMPETLTRSGNDTAAIMRRTPSGSASYRYRVLAADSAFDKNVNDLASKGFSPIGVFTQQSGMAASLGRPGRLYVVLEAPGGGVTPNVSVPVGNRYRVMSTVRTSTLEKEINQAAADGYRVLGGSFMNVLGEKGASSVKYNYRVIGAVRGATVRDEIRRSGLEGYRVVPAAIMRNPSSKGEIVFLMEHSAIDTRSYEYSFADASGSASALDDLIEKGFAPAALVVHGSYAILFEKGM